MWDKCAKHFESIKSKTEKKKKDLVDDNDELTKAGSCNVVVVDDLIVDDVTWFILRVDGEMTGATLELERRTFELRTVEYVRKTQVCYAR